MAFLLFPPDEGAIRRRYQGDLTGLVELEAMFLRLQAV
ncbi:hypothetical protein CHUV0807_1094 [Cardiobacterium hominis]|uniref:Uncharacterized protein n=1 Tax=Cardiobacterium hominis TaxID=2718 RepID=A0A1C3H3W4_9GAMM|nr:hypothetical protein CHUV0807_1094 [Cardiobacterium hominis]